jgi:osmoprotectant transport system ATP-binding protein
VSADPIVALRGVRVEVESGGERRAIVRALDLEIARGERLVLLGRSGSGKTTTLRLVNGLVRPSAGEVLVDGRAIGDLDAVALRRRIGYVIQDVGLFPHWRVRDNVALVPRLLRWDEARVDARVREVLGSVGLDEAELGDRFPNELSGGQRQRVGVARALAARPELVLLDEPFGAVDPVTRAELQRELLALASRLEATLVLVTHDLREAFTLATRIALLVDGELVLTATPDAFAASEHPEARAFLDAGAWPDGLSPRAVRS